MMKQSSLADKSKHGGTTKSSESPEDDTKLPSPKPLFMQRRSFKLTDGTSRLLTASQSETPNKEDPKSGGNEPTNQEIALTKSELQSNRASHNKCTGQALAECARKSDVTHCLASRIDEFDRLLVDL